MDGGNFGVTGSFADQSAGHGEGFFRVSRLDGRSKPLHITFAGSDPGQQWIRADVRQVDHTFGGGGGVGRWRVTQYFCGSGVEGMEPAGGLNIRNRGAKVSRMDMVCPRCIWTSHQTVRWPKSLGLASRALLAASKAFSSSP